MQRRKPINGSRTEMERNDKKAAEVRKKFKMSEMNNDERE